MARYTNEEIYQLILTKSKSIRTDTVLSHKLKKSTDEDLAVQCIEDDKRTLSLMDIISDTVREGDIAIDLGAGFGPLGFAALNAGASFVYGLELNQKLVSFINTLSSYLGLEKRLIAYNGDARYFRPEKDIDFVIAELVHTGLSQEPIVAAIQNIRRYASHNAQYIPERAISTMRLMDTENPLSDPIIYDDVFLPELDRKHVDCKIKIPVKQKGTPTHLEVNTRLKYPKGHETGTFSSLCLNLQTSILMSREQKERNYPFFLSEGQVLSIHANYNYGGNLFAYFDKIE